MSSKPKDEVFPQTTMKPNRGTAISSPSVDFTEQNTTQSIAPTPELLYSPLLDELHAEFLQPPIEEELTGICDQSERQPFDEIPNTILGAAASITHQVPTTSETKPSSESDSLVELAADMDILAYDEPVMILNGTENKWLCVHAASFFAVCHMERWHKTERGLEVLCPHGILKTTSRRILLLFLHWLYNDTFLCDDRSKALTYPDLINLYSLGEKWNAPLLKNAVMSYIVEKAMQSRKGFPRELFASIIDQTRPRSLLRKLWKDICWTMNVNKFHEPAEAGRVDPELREDATKVQIVPRERARDATKLKWLRYVKDISYYHETDPVTGLKYRTSITHCKHGSCGPGRTGDTPVSCETMLAAANAEIESLKRQLEDQGKLDDSALLTKKRKASGKNEGA